MNSCAAGGYTASLRRMQLVVRGVMSRLRDQDAQRRELTASQAAWTRYRDDLIDASERSPRSTAAYTPCMAYDCLGQLTIERTQQLSRFVHCKDGDLTCPGTADR